MQQPLEENSFPRDVWLSILSSLGKEKLSVFLMVSKYMRQLFYDSIVIFSVENHYDWVLWKRDQTIIEKCMNIQTLEVREWMGIKDDTIRHLRGLGMLYISHSSTKEEEEGEEKNCITDSCISNLTNLRLLDIDDTDIGDNGVSRLTLLTDICMRNNRNITDDGLKSLTNLENLVCNYRVTDNSISHLVKLRMLFLYNDSPVSDKSISRLTNLSSLIITSGSNDITDSSISLLTNLTSLTSFTNKLTGECIERLTNLEKLCCRRPVKFEHFAKLTNLKELYFYNHLDGNINMNEILRKLTKMEKLELGGNVQIRGGTIKCLTNLTYLTLGRTDIIKGRQRIINRKEGIPLDFVHINQETIQYFYA